MSVSSRVAGRYAKSLMDLAKEMGKLNDVVEDIKSIAAAVKNRDLYLLLQSPIITADKKNTIMNAIFGGKLSDLTMSFIKICIDKGREGLLPDISTEFLAEHKKMQGITTVKVTTATPLSTESIEAIRKQLISSSDTLTQVEIDVKIDPSLIGGYVVEFGDKLYDASVAHKLDVLKKGFASNLYESQIEKHGTI
ncbi:MAG: ATP synthase F1 subunit delta [Saprospiraceae bacterium]|nr:ATP synthase F1 subunit delta [Saprospiraceae bacterium]